MHAAPEHGRRAFLKSALLGATGVLAEACVRPAGNSRAAPSRSTGGPMQTVTSRDGTRIAFWRSGAGAAFLLE